MASSAIVLPALLVFLSASARGQESPSPRTATRQEYLACLEKGDEIEAFKSKLKTRNAEHASSGASLQAADESFNAQARRNPPKTKDDWASYNRAIDKRNAAAKEYNNRSKELERSQEEINAKILAFNDRCGSMLIDMETKVEVEEERRRRSGKQ